MIEELKKEFIKIYGESEKELHVYFAPGRVNLIGEHTDYNGGYVFPCALSYGTYLILRRTKKDSIKFASTNFDYKNEIALGDLPAKQPGDAWINYPLGVIDQIRQLNIEVQGLELLYSGNIPNGAGLSSSASVELVTGFALNDQFNQRKISNKDLALIGQKAENEFVGVNCGIMDQFAVAMGQKDRAIFLDCDTLEYELVPAEFEGCKLIISNTNKRRGLADSKYNERRTECDQAVEYISKKKDIKLLGELSKDDFENVKDVIPNETVRRRARHVVTEIDRVKSAVDALKAGQLDVFGKLMNASHDSLRDDYEVTGKELDTLVAEARKINGVIGSRMTGAGFGGCTVSLVKEEAIDEFLEKVGANYKAETGLNADFYIAEVGEGTRKL